MGNYSDPWTRLLAHALLRGSRIFPGLELCDKPPDYSPLGFTDIWKGEYHGKLVCIKVFRGQYLEDLREVERVRRCFIQLKVYSVRFIPDIPSRGQREQAKFSSECAPHHPGFKGTVSALHHESVDARWEHHSLYPNEPGCRSSDARTPTPA